jgi:cytochrome c biogenesis protein CcmG, thiol:disulfide interchange protein DsbE
MDKLIDLEGGSSSRRVLTRRAALLGGLALAGVAGGAVLWRKKDIGARFFNTMRLDQFELPPVPGLVDTQGRPVPGISSADLKGRLSILNLWASWCVSCREEHALLVDLAARGLAPIYGADVKDTPAHAREYLAEHGNPYVAVGADTGAYLQRALGARGVPATFVIGPGPRIEAAVYGPLSAEAIADQIIPALKKTA